jgi:hypothetical protein
VSSHHVTRQREVQKHAAELIPRDLVELHLDSMQMGVGGVHSWGAKPDPSVQLRPDVSYKVEFEVHPFGPGAGVTAGTAESQGYLDASQLNRMATDILDRRYALQGHPASFQCAFPSDEPPLDTYGGMLLTPMHNGTSHTTNQTSKTPDLPDTVLPYQFAHMQATSVKAARAGGRHRKQVRSARGSTKP